MALRNPTKRNYQRKKQRAVLKVASSSSGSKIRNYSFLTLAEIESGKFRSIGAEVAVKLKGSAEQKRQKLARVDLEISNVFSGKRSLLGSYLKSLPSSQRAALRTYASARIARVLDKMVRKKFGKTKRFSGKFKLNTSQQKLVYSLLLNVPGINKETLKKAINGQQAVLGRPEQHFQLSVAHFLENFVFSDKPKMGLTKALQRYQFAILNSKSYEEFADYLSQSDIKGKDGSFNQIKMLRLAGLQWEVKGTQLIFSKKNRPSTELHEAIHNILGNSNARDLSFSESFTHFVSCFVSEKTGVKIDYLSKGQRKRFDTDPHLAIVNFPWRNVTNADVVKLARGIKAEIRKNPGIKKQLYYGYFAALTPKVSDLFFNLLESKVSRYSSGDKKIVGGIAKQGLVDCANNPDLVQIKKRLQRLAKLTS
jgi:hypothetical protein